MDIGTVAGSVLAFLAILGSILLGGDVMLFVDIPSLVVVGFGVIANTLIKWDMGEVKSFGKYVMKAVFYTPADPASTIEEIGKLAEMARRESVFALEKAPIDDIFMKKAMTLAADNRPPEVISSILQMEIDAMQARHKTAHDMLNEMAADGPAFGMIGTLIGLVQMLANLSDAAAIGPAMAVALLTTFYGSVLANVFCAPFKNKLIVRSGNEATKMSITIAGTLGIVAGENPRLIKEKLNAFLPPSERPKGDEAKEGA